MVMGEGSPHNTEQKLGNGQSEVKEALDKGNLNSKNPRVSYDFPKRPLFGRATLRSAYQVISFYIIGAVIGTLIWFNAENVQLKLFGAGLIFPGSGYLALSRSYIWAFMLNTIMIPVMIFGWFWGGAVPLPLGVHYGAALVAAYVGSDRSHSSCFKYTPYVAWVINLVLLSLWQLSIYNMEKEQENIRNTRNEWITAQVEELDQVYLKGLEARSIGADELTPQQIGHLRYLINLTRQPINSWEGFTRLDQFREGALRYQLYYILYALSMVQNNIMPNFHGYLSLAQQTAIQKVLLPASLYYWALESTWGRFSLDWDPIKKDNIMLTGWFMAGIMMYTSTTRDMQYTKTGSLVCQVTPFHKYPHSIPSMASALTENWRDCSYTLYPCEPNWVYTLCNAYGVIGIQIYDRIFGTDNWTKIGPRFKKAWCEEFMLPGGDSVVLRSSLAGIGIAAAGALDNSLTLFTQSFIPDQAKQSSAKYRKECVETDENGKVTGLKFDAMDCLDAGNYKMHEKGDVGKVWALAAAKERGDTELVHYLEKVMTESVILKSDGKGGVFADEMSTMMAICYAMANLVGLNYMREVVENGPPEYTFQGPLLAEAPYPEIIVAKAWSNGRDLELVLYDGVDSKVTADLQLERLQPGMKYFYGERSLTPDADGKARMVVTVEGRTVFHLKLEN
ncbi:hypothetical protein BDW59DRAFT_163198 [Aspergillus cavernicola]|uniref:Linalool dehydratase/isomerase domain-containing protein n=1 Tax=Aspergillus cavernicola TaxID=176166 RepID=A0ABR4I7E0_9EURO